MQTISVAWVARSLRSRLSSARSGGQKAGQEGKRRPPSGSRRHRAVSRFASAGAVGVQGRTSGGRRRRGLVRVPTLMFPVRGRGDRKWRPPISSRVRRRWRRQRDAVGLPDAARGGTTKGGRVRSTRCGAVLANRVSSAAAAAAAFEALTWYELSAYERGRYRLSVRRLICTGSGLQVVPDSD